jgi:NAD(P)-dependent dehydrogenase (short-subunit alcohol dehydrogenase family)
MDLYLKRKRVLITGASLGIGLATANLFAEEGCDLILVARDEARLKEAAESIAEQHAVSVKIISADLSSEVGIEKVVANANAVDILINNAGAIPPGDLHEIDNGRWRQSWDLKVFGYINLTRALYQTLKTAKGVVVNVIGTSGERAEPNYITGSCGNAALMAFTRGLGSNSPRDGVRVVGVSPGPVATERIELLLRASAKRTLNDESRWHERFNAMPFGRAATPKEIANAVVFLASPRSSYTSGTILTIDDPARVSL